MDDVAVVLLLIRTLMLTGALQMRIMMAMVMMMMMVLIWLAIMMHS